MGWTSRIAVAVFVAALALYAATLAPTVTLVDSGELIAAAWSAGVPHPPGFPLYMLLAHLATLVPVGEVAARVNFASALFGALACAAVALAAAELVRAAVLRRAAPSPRGRKDRTPPPEPDSLALAVAAGAAGSLLAVSRAFWSYATIAEVYTLNTLLVALVALAVFRWRAEALAGRDRDRLLYAAGGLFGLALCVHHVTAALWAPGLAALVFATSGRRWARGRRLALAALAVATGLAVYVYLPVAASRDPAMNWGDPDSAGRFVRHVSGWMYQSNLAAEGGRLGEQVAEFVRIAAREYGSRWFPVGFALVAAGAVWLFRRDRTAFWSLALVAGAGLAYALAYDIAEDTEAYYLPVFVVWALAGGAGAAWLAEAARRRGVAWAAPVAVAAAVVVIAAGNLPYTNRRDERVARDYVANVLASVAPGGMVVTGDWQLYSPMLYVLEVAAERPDVVAINTNLLRRSWYVEQLRARHPSLAIGAGGEIDTYLADLRGWESDPDAYDRDPSLTSRIDARLNAMVVAIVREHMARAPVYVGQELIVSNESLARSIDETWHAVPEGLVFRLYGDTAYREPPPLALETRGLAGGGRRFDPDDVVALKVRPAYTGMLVNRAIYFATHGRADRAREAVDAALALDPKDPSAVRVAATLGGG